MDDLINVSNICTIKYIPMHVGALVDNYSSGLPLRRPYFENLKYFPTIPNSLTNVSEFDIIDIRWCNNDELWTTLLEAMKEYKKLILK